MCLKLIPRIVVVGSNPECEKCHCKHLKEFLKVNEPGKTLKVQAREIEKEKIKEEKEEREMRARRNEVESEVEIEEEGERAPIKIK